MIEREPSLDGAPWRWPLFSRPRIDPLAVATAVRGCDWVRFFPGVRIPAVYADAVNRIVREKIKRGAKLSALTWNQRIEGGPLLGLRLHYRDADHEAFFWLTPPRTVRRDLREPAQDSEWTTAIHLVGQRWRLVARHGARAPGWRLDRELRFEHMRMAPGWVDGGATVH